MEKIKRYWKGILIAFLVIFSLNKCTVACNRATKIDNLEHANQDYKTAYDSLLKVNDIQKIRLDDSQKSNESYAGIATTNQNALIKKNDSLRGEITKLNSTINSLKSENAKLKQENKNLKK